LSLPKEKKRKEMLVNVSDVPTTKKKYINRLFDLPFFKFQVQEYNSKEKNNKKPV
jgi:hypothetical protein